MRKLTAMTMLAMLTLSSLTMINPARAQSAMTDGVVTKVNPSANKITIKHGPMKKFGMDDGMTMVYTVKSPDLLSGIKSGDKIKFDADEVNGQFIVTKIAPAP
ncbi:MAG: RND transporter [Rhodopseudomonas sp.]|nr:RND transporter [Rhodopseudomonas sp.]